MSQVDGNASRAPFGQLADGTPVEIATLTNGRLTARVMTLGATLQSLFVPDRDGRVDDVVLGHDSAAEYLVNPQYFGATVGRYANRIAGGLFALDGRLYQLDINNGSNHLHGGGQGLHQHVWRIVSVEEDSARVTMEVVSAEGEGGYPGTLTVSATYTLGPDALRIDYRATSDAPTIVNVTNHSYFNLGGAGAGVMDHRLTLHASAFTPVDAGLIPTGELRPVAGTAFDFRDGPAIGSRIRDGDPQLLIGQGYDHNFVADGPAGTLRPIARLADPVSGRAMELLATAPGVQFYSGNFLDGTQVGKGGRTYRQGDALCLEPQLFPDGPNRPEFPSARLDPGDTYANSMVFRFTTDVGAAR